MLVACGYLKSSEACIASGRLLYRSCRSPEQFQDKNFAYTEPTAGVKIPSRSDLGASLSDFHVSPVVVRFGAFELDRAAGELRRDGAKVRLQELPFQVLQILLEQPGKVILRDELKKRIWPSDTFVDFDHGINNAIKRLREALQDTAERPHILRRCPGGAIVSRLSSTVFPRSFELGARRSTRSQCFVSRPKL